MIHIVACLNAAWLAVPALTAIGSQTGNGIPDSEPNVLKGKALGWEFRIDSPVKQCVMPKTYSSRPVQMSNAAIHFKRLASAKPDRFDLQMHIERTDKNAQSNQGASGMELVGSGERRFGIGYNGMPSSRLSYLLRVTRYRTFSDAFVLKNAKIKVGNIKQAEGKSIPVYYVVACDNPNIVTPGGIKMRLWDYGAPPRFADKLTHLKFRFNQSINLIDIASSPLRKETKKPARIAPAAGYSYGYDGKELELMMPLPVKPHTKDWTEPKLKVMLVHRSDIESQTVRLVAPTKTLKTDRELWKSSIHKK